MAIILKYALPEEKPLDQDELVKSFAKTLVQDPNLSRKLIQKTSAPAISETVQDGRSKEDMLIQEFLLEKKDQKTIVQELAEEPSKSLASLEKVYMKMRTSEYDQDRAKLLDLAKMLNDKSPEANEEVKQFFLETIESGVDPVDESDPLASNSIKAIRYYLSLESDPIKRQNTISAFQEKYPDPLVKNEMERLLEDEVKLE